MESNEDAVGRFRAVTGTDEDTAAFYLRRCDGQVEEAIHMFYRADGIMEELRPEVQQGAPAAAPRAEESVLGRLGSFVSGVVTAPFRAVRYIVESSARDPSDEALAIDFVRSFEYHYGSRHPQFVELGWKEAAQMAEQQSKLLFAYVHAPEHEETEAFCRQVLSSNEVASFLNRNFVCWGGSIHRSPAFRLATNTGATTFPFMCLLGHIGAQVTVIASIQGSIQGLQLVHVLQQSLEAQGSALVAQRAERRQQEIDRQLRRDQDLEYQQALEADRERDRKNREAAAARAALEEEARQKAEKERLAKEAEERHYQERAAAIVQRRFEKQAALKPEPTQTGGIIQIRVRLPDGSTHTRKFLETAKVEEVYDYVDGLDPLHCWDYTLASSYPKIEFSQETRNRSLIEIGVEHSATLLVQSHDD